MRHPPAPPCYSRATRMTRAANSREPSAMTVSAKLCVATLAALALASAAGLPARALFITSERAVGLVEDNTEFTTVRQDTADTAAGRDFAAVSLGDGTNAFGQQAVAGAFGAFPTQQGVYWVVLNADNTINLGDDGRGFAR